MTKSPLRRESSPGFAKKNCAEELSCIQAAQWTLVRSKPCESRVRRLGRCILFNRSAASLFHRSKEESLRLKAKRRPCEWRGESRGNSVVRPCVSRGTRSFCI